MDISSLVNYKIYDRGKNYYQEGKILEMLYENDKIVKGKVEGNHQEFYNVKIDLENINNSECDCPYAKENNRICKHMIAILLKIAEETGEKYGLEKIDIENQEYDYDEDEEYDYDEYDYYNNKENNEENEDFIQPVFYEEIVDKYLNNMKDEDIRKILKIEFMENKKHFFYKYLFRTYKKIYDNSKDIIGIIEKVNRRFHNLIHNYDFNYKDYEEILLYKDEKKKIKENYLEMKKEIEEVLIKPELSVYNEYKWIIKLFKENNNETEIAIYIHKLEEYLKQLKQYTIKNTIPKSNVLIAIYILSNFSIEETATSMIKNCKYDKYLNYLIENAYNVEELYNAFNSKVQEIKFFNKEKIAKIYYEFYEKIKSKDIYAKYLYYEFLYSYNTNLLQEFKDKIDNYNEYFDQIINKTKNIVILKNMYIFLDKKQELFELLYNNKNDLTLIECVDYLKNDYNNQLEKYFKDRFIETIDMEKSRKNYNKASMYIRALYRLNKGKEIVSNYILELKKSPYFNRRAMFDEIERAISLEKTKN